MGKEDLILNIRANPCVNRCHHCWTEGSPKRERMESAEIKRILDALSDTREIAANRFFFLFDEPTFRDDFLDIIEYAAKLDLVDDNFWMPSNGFGLARGDEEYWRRLKDTGIGYLQFIYFGIGDVHDEFAGRKGAFDDLVMSMRKADEYGVDYVVATILRPRDEGDVTGTVDYLSDIATGQKVGWFLYMNEGRGSSLSRPRLSEIVPKIEEETLTRKMIYPEYKHIERILGDSSLSNKTADIA